MKKFAINVSIIIALWVIFAVQTFALPTDGLVVYYTFDSNTINGDKVKDQSGQGNDGTINGGGKAVGGVLQFDGVGVYVVTPALDVRTGKKPFTAIGWFNTDKPKNGPLWMWGDNAVPSASSGAEGPVGWRASSGNFTAGFYTAAHQYAEAKQNYADNKPHCVAQVGDEDTGYLYVDGKQIASAIAGYVYAAKPFFLIGARTKNSGSDIDDIEYFTGSIDQIAIYNVALSENDILKISAEFNAVDLSGKLASVWGAIKR